MAKARSSYHAATLALLGIKPLAAKKAAKAIADREAALGFTVPASVREWYETGGAAAKIPEFYDGDRLVPAENLGDPNDLRHGLLKFLVETQGVADWYVRLDGSEDPSVEVVSEMYATEDEPIGDDVDTLDLPDWRRPEADHFSEFLYRRAERGVGTPGIRDLVRDLRAVNAFVILEGGSRIVEVWLRGPGVSADLLARLGAVETLASLKIEPGGIARADAWKALAGLAGVTELTVFGRSAGDAAVRSIAAMTGLVELSLNDTGITDRGFCDLLARRPLRTLGVDTPHLTPAGFACLGRQSSLVDLNLLGSTVTDEALAAFVGMEHLEDLNLIATGVTDAGVRHLGGLPRLRCLELGDTKVRGTTLDALAPSGTLEALVLNATEVDDDALPRIATIASLRVLNLNSTGVTGRHLDLIAAMPNLREVYLHGTPIPPAAIEAVRRSAPGLEITHSPA